MPFAIHALFACSAGSPRVTVTFMERTERKLPPGWRIKAALTTFWLLLLPGAFAQQPVLMWSIPAKAVTNGTPITVWLNVLNTSSVDITSSFPARIECRLILENQVAEVPIARRYAENPEDISIAAGK